MKLMRKTIALLIAVLMLCAISMPALGEPGEQQSPGLDVVIVMDFSSSTFPGLPGEHADGEFMSLDAAAMLINMCDSEFSNVAVVPFTQGAEYWKEFNKSQNADLWYNWIDMSDMDRRSALCDSLFGAMVFQASTVDGVENHTLRNGRTNYEYAMRETYNLIAERETDNQVLVLVLGDGINSQKNTSVDQAIAYARQIEDLGGIIFSLQFGHDEAGTELMEALASSPEAHWQNVQPEELKEHYSAIFAGLIGTRTKPIDSSTTGSELTFEIGVPHKAISEVNVVIDRNKAGSDGDVTVYNPDGAIVENGENLFVYSKATSDFKKSYDFVSVKIINPDPGNWVVSANRANGVPSDEQLSVDLLYNYEIELRAALATPGVVGENVFKKKSKFDIEAGFVNADGTASDDETLYYGVAEDGSGIQATLNIYDKNDNVVYSRPMTPDAENKRFYTEINVEAEGFIDHETDDEQLFNFSVSAEGDYLVRETGIAGSFVIVGEKPYRKVNGDVDLGTIYINDVLSDSPNYLESESMSHYFGCEETLVFSSENVISSQGLKYEFLEGEDPKLRVEPSGNGNAEDCYVTVVAKNRAGSTSEPVTFHADVVSIKELVESCVAFRIEGGDMDDESGVVTLNKGDESNGSYTVKPYYELPEGASRDAFPYNYLSNVDLEKLAEKTTYEFDIKDRPNGTNINSNEATGAFSVQAGDTSGAFSVTVTPKLGEFEFDSQSVSFEVTNQKPTLAEGLEALLSEKGAAVDENGKLTFTVDCDREDDSKLSFDLSKWFEDADGDHDALHYRAEIEPAEEDSDIFSKARSILRAVNLIQKDGDVITANTDADGNVPDDGKLSIDAVRFGNAAVTVTATDNDGESVPFTINYKIASSMDQLKCIICYAVILLIIIIILIILYNRLIVHAKWPSGKGSGYEVILNGFAQYNHTGEQTSKFNKTGRRAITLRELAKQFDIQDDGAGNSLFSSIKLWPTTGGRIVVEGSKHGPRNAEVLVEGKKLGAKAKWGRGSITCKYRDSNGIEHTCVFKRR